MKKFFIALTLLGISLAAFAQGASGPDDLSEQYKTAIRQKNMTALMALVPNDSEKERKIAEATFSFHLQYDEVVSVKQSPISAYQTQYDNAMKSGVKLSVQPKGWMQFEFKPRQSAGGVVEKISPVFLYGVRDGRYYFAFGS